MHSAATGHGGPAHQGRPKIPLHPPRRPPLAAAIQQARANLRCIALLQPPSPPQQLDRHGPYSRPPPVHGDEAANPARPALSRLRPWRSDVGRASGSPAWTDTGGGRRHWRRPYRALRLIPPRVSGGEVCRRPLPLGEACGQAVQSTAPTKAGTRPRRGRPGRGGGRAALQPDGPRLNTHTHDDDDATTTTPTTPTTNKNKQQQTTAHNNKQQQTTTTHNNTQQPGPGRD